MRVEPAVPSIYRNKSPHFTTFATSLQWKPAAAHSARIATRFTAVPRAKFAERIMFKLRPTKINLSRAVFPTSLIICIQKDAEQVAFRWLVQHSTIHSVAMKLAWKRACVTQDFLGSRLQLGLCLEESGHDTHSFQIGIWNPEILRNIEI